MEKLLKDDFYILVLKTYLKLPFSILVGAFVVTFLLVALKCVGK
jgi:hypothetical protein